MYIVDTCSPRIGMYMMRSYIPWFKAIIILTKPNKTNPNLTWPVVLYKKSEENRISKKKIFSDFADFWEFFEHILSFKKVLWPSRCDLDYFKSIENFQNFSYFTDFLDFLANFFFTIYSSGGFPPTIKPRIPYVYPIVVCVRNQMKIGKNWISDTDRHKPISD